MSTLFLPCSFFALLLSACAFISASRPLSMDALRTIPSSLTLADVEQRFGPATPGHGPYCWYPCAGHPGHELWFWYAPTRPHREAKTGADIRIAYVSITTAEDPDEQRFVWPASATKLDANATLARLYKNVR